MNDFAENLKKYRTKHNVSQEELAKKVNIHPVQFSRYERGQSIPSIEVVQKIADALEISIDMLVYGNEGEKAEKNIADNELLVMFKKIQLLNDRQKETVKDFLSSYILTNELKQKLV